jgi:hypothetical protein
VDLRPLPGVFGRRLGAHRGERVQRVAFGHLVRRSAEQRLDRARSEPALVGAAQVGDRRRRDDAGDPIRMRQARPDGEMTAAQRRRGEADVGDLIGVPSAQS